MLVSIARDLTEILMFTRKQMLRLDKLFWKALTFTIVTS